MLVVNFLSQPIELHQPGFTDSLSRHGCLKGILPESFILMFVVENADRSLHSKNEVVFRVRFKCEAAACLWVYLELDDWVFQTTCLEGDNWSAADEEFVLHDAARLE